MNFSPTLEGLEPFREDLQNHTTTKSGLLQIPYDSPMPEDLIRRIAERRLLVVSERDDDSFW